VPAPAAAFELGFPDPDDGAEPEPDGFVGAPPPGEEEEEAAEDETAEQDEELTVPEPESDPPATVLPWPVPDDGDAAAVGAAAGAAAEVHPAVGLEFDWGEDEFDGAAGAAVLEPAPDEPVGAAAPAEDEPAGVVEELLEEAVPALVDESDPALVDESDPTLAGWSELPAAVVEAVVDEFGDAPLELADPCVAVPVPDGLVPAAEPTDDAVTRLVPVETDAPIAFCSVAEELTSAAFAYGAATTIAASAAMTARQTMPRRHAFSVTINSPLANPMPLSTSRPLPPAPAGGRFAPATVKLRS
jgi:hypothetical protein